MEFISLFLFILCFLIVISIDTIQKRRRFLNRGK